jgi:hypothetical protein
MKVSNGFSKIGRPVNFSKRGNFMLFWSKETKLSGDVQLFDALSEAIDICREHKEDVAFDFAPKSKFVISYEMNLPEFSKEFSLGYYSCLFQHIRLYQGAPKLLDSIDDIKQNTHALDKYISDLNKAGVFNIPRDEYLRRAQLGQGVPNRVPGQEHNAGAYRNANPLP